MLIDKSLVKLFALLNLMLNEGVAENIAFLYAENGHNISLVNVDAFSLVGSN